MNPEESKICPYCCEEIKINARKCKHCHSYLDDKGTFLEDDEAQGVEGARPVDREARQDKDTGDNALIGTGKSMMTCGCLLTLFITLPVLFILFLGGC
ncbi:MAG: hypothetical protein R6U91_03780 [Bacillota bacterium]